MANENKNINELVADDDDPTAELEILSFEQFDAADVELESDSDTYGFGKESGAPSSSGQSIPELESDLENRTQTIGRLQYDIEQLRAKWLGLETEIKAREGIVGNLLQEVDELKAEVSRKDKLLRQRSKTIKTLKTEIGQRDEKQTLLEQQHDEFKQQLADQRSTDADNVSTLEEVERELQETRSKLETAQDEITSLNSEISERDKTNGLFEQRRTDLEQQIDQKAAALAEKERELAQLNSRLLTTQDQSTAERLLAQQTSTSAVKEAETQLARAEEYADTLRYKLQEFTDAQSRWSKERNQLNESIEQASERNWYLSELLGAADASLIELQAALKQQHADHEQEIQTLRFELAEAQDAVTETSDLNAQLASDLMDTRGFNTELEGMLRENDDAAQKRTEDLEKRVSELAQMTEDLEQKLGTKNNTISVLLGELAKKSEQIESIDEIENVIQEIDNRMSERFDDQDKKTATNSDSAQESVDRDRITRVLIGNFGDQELRFPLFKNRLTIGRNEDNDIQLKTTYVSRRHAVILTEGDATRVIDWGSKNGVYVNSKRVKEHSLSNGDVVAIGNVKFRYEERPKRDT